MLRNAKGEIACHQNYVCARVCTAKQLKSGRRDRNASFWARHTKCPSLLRETKHTDIFFFSIERCRLGSERNALTPDNHVWPFRFSLPIRLLSRSGAAASSSTTAADRADRQSVEPTIGTSDRSKLLLNPGWQIRGGFQKYWFLSSCTHGDTFENILTRVSHSHSYDLHMYNKKTITKLLLRV